MLEKDIQKRFFNLASSCKGDVSPGLQIYRELVRYRFEELLSDSFPISKQLIGETLWHELLTAFILKKPKSPIIWEAADEFRVFICKKRFGLPEKVKETLWFESMKITCHQAIGESDLCCIFDWNKSYILTKSSVITTFTYMVYGDFSIGIFPTLLYRDKFNFEVYYIELTEFMYKFLKKLQKQDAKSVLKNVVRKYGLDGDESKAIMQASLDDMISAGILIRKTY